MLEKFDPIIKNKIMLKTRSGFFRNLFRADTEGKGAELVLSELNYDPENFTNEEKKQIDFYIANKGGFNTSRGSTGSYYKKKVK